MEAGAPLCLVFLKAENPWGASGWEGGAEHPPCRCQLLPSQSPAPKSAPLFLLEAESMCPCLCFCVCVLVSVCSV